LAGWLILLHRTMTPFYPSGLPCQYLFVHRTNYSIGNMNFLLALP